MNLAEVLDHIGTAITTRRRLIMANLNVHGMAMMFENERMARLFSQSDTRIMIDSMPLVFLANLFGYRVPRTMRTTSLDFYDDLFEMASARKWKVAYVGADKETLARGMNILKERFPQLDLAGHDGFFDIGDVSPGSENARILDWLNDWSPDIVIVGMGMPRQEEWIYRVQNAVDARVFLPTGAYLDFQVGTQKMAPRWMGQYGVEWVYRLFSDPRRLAYRYMVEPFVLAKYLILRRHPQRAPNKVEAIATGNGD